MGANLDAGATSDQPDAGRRGGQGIELLDHLIFIVQENRSFDHYFGTFPGAKGFPRDRRGRISVCIPDPVLGHCSRPYHTNKQFQDGGPHSHPAAVKDVNKGKMNGFIKVASAPRTFCANARRRFTKRCRPFIGPKKQPDVMSYMTGKQIPNYWRYAREFVLEDRMFAPTDSWTLPAHLFLVSGWSAYCPVPTNPMSCRSNIDLKSDKEQWNYFEPPKYGWTDITWLLKEHGVEWGYYVGEGTCWQNPCDDQPGPWGRSLPGKNPLPGFVSVRESHQMDRVLPHQEYLDAAAAGTLPSVSWIVPGNRVSEHPAGPTGIRSGMAHVTRMVNAAMEGPDWDSTAIFVTWDDWGGFYDHVVPPRVDRNGYGLRVPGLVISPYSKAGKIDHQTLSFDAYLKLIEDRFLGGERLDPETLSRPDSRPTVREELRGLGDLARSFDFTQPPRPPLILDPTPFG